METIAINANDDLREDGQEKKKFKVSDSAKAAMGAGVAGLAAGAAVKSAIDSLSNENVEEEYSDEEQTIQNDPQANRHEAVAAESEALVEAPAEVNSEEVMLEEPVAEPSADIDMIVEETLLSDEENPYQPFAANDKISDEVLQEPMPDEILVVDNPEVDVIIVEDPLVDVDVIDGTPAIEPDVIGEPEDPFGESYADNGSYFEDSDIQSDIMA